MNLTLTDRTNILYWNISDDAIPCHILFTYLCVENIFYVFIMHIICILGGPYVNQPCVNYVLPSINKAFTYLLTMCSLRKTKWNQKKNLERETKVKSHA